MRFVSKPITENNETPLADDGRWEAIIERFDRRHQPARARDAAGNACYVVSVLLREAAGDPGNQLREILGLVRAHGDRVVGHEQVRIVSPAPRTYLGRGASEAIAERAVAAGADTVVVDAELSPSQMRNLEDAVGLPIADREAVILEVFEANARTRRAKIQVEVAHLEYLRPRIRGLGLEMDQQAGGVMRARGPGETASELLARRLDGRLAGLRRALRKLERAAEQQRHRRDGCGRVALVGYTNAGKTSLMNALTGANLSAKDSPFETLDATARSLTRRAGDVVISDTVGFIRRLPQRLMASFESTLAEIREATLLAIVVDLSDAEWPMHVATTDRVLERLEASAIPRLYLLNKLDVVAEPPPKVEVERVVGKHPWVALSTRHAAAVARLRRTLVDRARPQRRIARAFVPYEASELMTLVHARCDVLLSEAKERGIRFTVEGDADVVARLQGARKERRSW